MRARSFAQRECRVNVMHGMIVVRPKSVWINEFTGTDCHCVVNASTKSWLPFGRQFSGFTLFHLIGYKPCWRYYYDNHKIKWYKHIASHRVEKKVFAEWQNYRNWQQTKKKRLLENALRMRRCHMECMALFRKLLECLLRFFVFVFLFYFCLCLSSHAKEHMCWVCILCTYLFTLTKNSELKRLAAQRPLWMKKRSEKHSNAILAAEKKCETKEKKKKQQKKINKTLTHHSTMEKR